jgi:dolichol-phosphate mannosyltransferase
MHHAPEISVISPVYNSADIIPELVRRLHGTLSNLTQQYEIILVDDASTDSSAKVIADIAELDKRVIGIFLSKNIGQHPAILRGLIESKGSSCVVMDCDLQDPPESIADMYSVLSADTEAVYAIRKKSYNSAVQRGFSAFFYKSLSFISGISMSSEIANFGLYQRKVIDALLQKQYRYFLFPLAVRKIAKNYREIEVEHARRFAGNSTYSFYKAFALAMKALVANSIFGIIFKKRSVQELAGYDNSDDTI